VRGHRRIAAWLAVIAAVHLGWTFEWLAYVEHGERSAPLLRVLDANLLAPRPSDALADEILSADADVLALQEVSDVWLARLDARGAREAYPFRIAEPHPLDHDYFGIAILSRRPFTSATIEPLPGIDFCPMARADLEIDGARVRIYSIHTAPPATPEWATVWMEQMDWLDARLRRDLAEHDVVIATGDLNLSPFSFGHRRLRALGMSEAHEAVGRGTALTWPNGVFGAPPMRLDHAYVHGAAIRSVRELPAHTSDHSPLLIELGH
jgi:endonuclease/exonuclease/phosphatase (EEP) superfamily protein YafD